MAGREEKGCQGDRKHSFLPITEPGELRSLYSSTQPIPPILFLYGCILLVPIRSVFELVLMTFVNIYLRGEEYKQGAVTITTTRMLYKHCDGYRSRPTIVTIDKGQS